MLRKIRLTAAVIFFTLITLLFLDFTGTIHQWFGWMAKIQFLPALLAVNIGIVIGLIVLTDLLFGYLSSGSISGCCFMDSRKTKEEPFFVFPGS